MRYALIALICSQIGAANLAPKPDVGVGVGGSGKLSGGYVDDVYNLSFGRPDVDTIDDMLIATGVTPSWAWFAHTPLTATGSMGGALTQASGTAVAQNAPFCPNGDWSSLSSCQNARRFDADVYQTSSSSLTLSGDVTVCSAFRHFSTTAADGYIFSSNAGTGDGIELKVTTGSGGVGVLTASGTATTASLSNNRTDQWQVVCMVASDTANTWTSYQSNGSASGTGTFTSGTWAPGAERFFIGARDGSATNPFVGDILWVAVFGDDLTSAQVAALFQRQLGIGQINGVAATTLSSTANTCCFVDGKFECFSGSFPPLGCESPGTNGSNGGILMVASISDRFIRTRTLNTGWTETGTSVVGSPSTADTIFATGSLGVYPVTDDNGAGAEYISQTISITFVTAAKQFGAWARTVSGSGFIDAQVHEQTGASCTESDVAFASQALTTDWTFVRWTYSARADSDCTNGVFSFSPTSDITNAALTGSIYLLPTIVNRGVIGPVFAESGAASAAVGPTRIFWTNTLTGMNPDNTHNWVYEIDFAPIGAGGLISNQDLATGLLAYLNDGNASPTEYIGFEGVTTSNDFRGTYNGNAITYAAFSASPGVYQTIRLVANYGADTYTLYSSAGAQLAQTTTAAAAPTTLDSLAVGNNPATTRDLDPGVMINRLRGYRTK